MMKAIRIHQFGGPEVLKYEELEEPMPDAGVALVRLMAAGVNFVDIYHRRGTYAAPAELPFTPGLEGAGIVEAVGPTVTEVKPGDRVAYTGQIGSYSEKNLVKADKLILLPDNITFEQAAALPLQGMTAHYLLHEFRKLQPGDIVLIHAAAGGMGLLLVQWARHLGAHVIGTVSTEEKAKAATLAGCHDVIIYTKYNFVNEIKRLTNNHGADLIIDGVGKTTFDRELEACATRGHVVLYGTASGAPDPIDPRILMPKSLTLSSGSLHNFTRTREELNLRANAVIEGWKQGWLQFRINRILPLKQAQEAHRLLENRETVGKILLATA
jgi:NADPH2:quinone reductase